MNEPGRYGYAFTTPHVVARLEQIIAMIGRAPTGRVRSAEVGEALCISQTTACAYLNHLHLDLKIRPYRFGNRNGMEYGLGADPDMEGTSGKSKKGDRARIVRRNAADCTGPVPVDPMREFLFGPLRKIK